jgi:hypothetical protein
MSTTIIGEFDTRRSAELAVEHLVQEHRVPRGDVSVRPAGAANTTGTKPAGSDAKIAPEPEGEQVLNGPVQVTVDLHGDKPEKISEMLITAGARSVRTEGSIQS